MKLRKILSMAVTVAMVMTSIAVIALPAVSAAETVNTSTEYFEDFNEMTLTANTTGQATMEALKTKGWFPVDNTKAYTTADYSESIFQFAKVVADGTGNKCLMINTPNSKSTNYYYGLGRKFPGQGDRTSTSGVWDITFRVKAYTNKIKAQFNFGVNTWDPTADATDAQHNFVSAYNNKMFLGYRDYQKLIDDEVSIDTVPSSFLNGNWYDIKVVLDCNNRYYSVEVWQNGALGARRSAISFAGDEAIGFFKMSALGMKIDDKNAPAAVYVDDVHIKRRTSRETLIYNETFQGIGSVKTNATGMTTGDETEDVSGDSFFAGLTPWRALESVGKSHNILHDNTLNSKVVRLGDDTATEETTEASGLVYMPPFDKLLDSSTQGVRGKVKLSFKFQPSVIGSTDFSVNAIASHTQDITNDSARIFRITKDPSNGTPYLYKPGGSQVLSASTWYQAELVIDVVNHTVKTTLKAQSGSLPSFDRTFPHLTALKGIMFKADSGTSVLMDDVKLEYYEPAPTIGGVSWTDAFGNTGTETTGVSPALEKIVIPVGCDLNSSTATTDTIKLTDSDTNEITYESLIVGDAYTLILNSDTISTVLKPNKEYTVTVPATIKNIFGNALGTAYTYTFTTGDLPKLMDIASVKVDGNADASLSDIHVGSAINVDVNYANSTNAAINGTVIVVFYGGGKVIRALTDDITVDAGEYGTDSTTFDFTVPSDLDMRDVDAVSVLLWDNFTDITPQCPAVNFSNN